MSRIRIVLQLYSFLILRKKKNIIFLVTFVFCFCFCFVCEDGVIFLFVWQYGEELLKTSTIIIIIIIININIYLFWGGPTQLCLWSSPLII